MIDDRLVGDGFRATRAIEDGNRHAPNALARDAPIGPALEHVAHAIDAPRGNPLHTLDLLQRGLAQRSCFRSFDKILSEVAAVPSVLILLDNSARSAVHRDEPLRRRAKNYRIMAAPAVRITVLVVLCEKQNAALAHEIDDFRVRLEN